MRLPNRGRWPKEDLAGKVCVDTHGRIAVVAGQWERGWEIEKECPTVDRTYHVGVGIDGKGLWKCMEPIILAENITEYYKMLEGPLGVP